MTATSWRRALCCVLLLLSAAGCSLADHADSYIQLAARQSLLDTAAQHGLKVLKEKLGSFSVALIEKDLPIPLVGTVQVTISDLKVQEFQISEDYARLVIMDSFFHLRVSQVMMKLDFKWHWEKGPIHGTGGGDLLLQGGAIDFVFKVESNPSTKQPELQVMSDGGIFDEVELNIHSATTDWLYQAVMRVFRDVISDALERAIQGALSSDVPQAVNQVLSSLPTTISIEGTPISFNFDYSIYTLKYVMIKGSAELVAGGLQQQQVQMRQVLMVAEEKKANRKMLAVNSQCPYPSSHLPLKAEDIAIDPHMMSVYAHENMVNCLMLSFFNSGLMKASLVNGAIPKLHLTTDLLGTLIPQLGKRYPHENIRVDLEALVHPKVAFSASEGASLYSYYRLAIYVDNQDLGIPHIATLRANLSVSASVTWDSTVIRSAVVKHELEPGASFDVPITQWDMTVGWFIQNYAGLFPLSQVVEKLIQAPSASLANLVNAEVKVLDNWFAVSGDVQILGGF